MTHFQSTENFEIFYTISICARLKLCNFDTIAMSMPLDKKRSRGRIPLRIKALQRDPYLLADIPRTIEDSEISYI